MVDIVANDLRASTGASLGVLEGVVFGAKAFSISADSRGLDGFLSLDSTGIMGREGRSREGDPMWITGQEMKCTMKRRRLWVVVVVLRQVSVPRV